MRTRLLLLFAFAAATIFTNVAFAGNIAHGVEVVVIDAGHGGKFPGAYYGGVYEKDLTLKVALKLGTVSYTHLLIVFIGNEFRKDSFPKANVTKILLSDK